MKILKNSNKIELELLAGKIKRFLLLKCIIAFSLIAPIAILVAFLIFADEVPIDFTYIFSFVIFWGVATYFTRLYLWNRFGTEHYKISQGNINYYYKYKYFKDGTTSIDFETIQIGYLKDNTIFLIEEDKIEELDTKYKLVFYINPKNQIITETEISPSEIMKIYYEVTNFTHGQNE